MTYYSTRIEIDIPGFAEGTVDCEFFGSRDPILAELQLGHLRLTQEQAEKMLGRKGFDSLMQQANDWWDATAADRQGAAA